MLYRFKKRKSESDGSSLECISGGAKKVLPKALFEAFKKGEEWAFSKIYLIYKNPILRYVSQRVGDQEIVNDLGQEIFLKAHRFRSSYQSQYTFSTWLWTIARNTVSDWYRKHSRGEWMESSNPEDSLFFEEKFSTPEPNAEILLEREAERQGFMQLLEKLTDLQKKVLWMRVIHQLSYQEIAKKLGLSLSAVKCLVYRSKKALSEMGCSPVFA